MNEFTVDPGRFEDLALPWLASEARELLDELARLGFEDEVRRVAAGNYLFGLAARLDGSEGDSGVRLVFRDGGGYVVGDETISLHEYILGTIDEILGR